MRKLLTVQRISRSVGIVLGLVLIWRGVWYVLDGLDSMLFGDSHVISSIGGIAFGLLILWWPDGDLKEIEKL